MTEDLAFVDIGAHTGQTIIKAMQEFPYCKHYYAVEPMQYHIAAAKTAVGKVRKGKEPPVSFCQAALDVLTEGRAKEVREFYEDLGGSRQGSTLLSDKRVNQKRKIEVPCLDVDFYFKNYVDRAYKLILKIDIEGKEYDILEHLLSNGFLTARVIRLFVEWHWHKTKTISEARHWNLVKELNAAGFPVTGHSSKDEFWVGA